MWNLITQTSFLFTLFSPMILLLLCLLHLVKIMQSLNIVKTLKIMCLLTVTSQTV
jgi:hypothetical protein